MSFTSLSFLGFVLVVAILYFTLFRKCQWFLLLLASIAFYMFSGPKYIVYISITAVTTYLFAGKIQKLHDREKKIIGEHDFSKEKKKSIKKQFTAKRKVWLLLDLVINLGMLCVIKYMDFALRGMSAVLAKFGVDWSKSVSFVLPLGISFYTFMTVGYILDVYWKRYRAEKNILKLALFTSYFPHIVQGPIGRYNKLAEQFNQRYKFDYDRVKKGLLLMLWGYFEKMVIADRLAIFANGVYAKWDEVTGLPLVLAIIFFSMQLYLDWTGCMDIARGVSQIFGIELERNFWHPYFSKNMPEFWRRWHISLSTWFRDYVYIPLGGNRVNKFKWIRNIILVWLLTGLWHGAAWNFIIWGIYYGLLLLFEKLFFDRILKKLPTIINWLYTFIIVMIGWMIFRSNSLNELLLFIKTMFVYKQTDWLTILADNLSTFNALMFVLPAFILSFPILKKIKEKYSGKTIYIILTNILLLMLFIMCIVYLTSSSYNPFIYFRF